MKSPEYDREELLEHGHKQTAPAVATESQKALQWASDIGNSGVQRIARSPAGRRAPIRQDSLPLASGVLARQMPDEEGAVQEGGGVATAEQGAAPQAEGAEQEGSQAPAAQGAEGAQAAGPEVAGAEQSPGAEQASAEQAGPAVEEETE